MRTQYQDIPLLSEEGHQDKTGIDLSHNPPQEPSPYIPKSMLRKEPLDLPGLSEPETVRHYVALSQQNYAIDLGPFPLGSCTMKHNSRLGEKMARLDGFQNLHPLQPFSTVQGALALMDELSTWLAKLCKMPLVVLPPKAGAQGELCGLLMIRKALEKHQEVRDLVLIPDTAHGTNPATARMAGYGVKTLPTGPEGYIRKEDVEKILTPEVAKRVAAIMITNPNTAGIYERDIQHITQYIHDVGGYCYCDGANFNALIGMIPPGILGIDVMHLNLHKTFSTPHGGGGPGSGVVMVSKDFQDYIPPPFLIYEDGQLQLQEVNTHDHIERLWSFHGQFGTFVRALCYILSHGLEGLEQTCKDAVLNANYLRYRLKKVLPLAYEVPCMHEVLFNGSFLKKHKLSTQHFAKAMIDKGIHPMTTYFPLMIPEAMLVEPTETESLTSLNTLITAMETLAKAARDGQHQCFQNAPKTTPRRKIDETQAARNPILTWKDAQKRDKMAKISFSHQEAPSR